MLSSSVLGWVLKSVDLDDISERHLRTSVFIMSQRSLNVTAADALVASIYFLIVPGTLRGNAHLPRRVSALEVC